MVDVTGHIAFGLLFALPAWFIWNGRASVVFIALAATTSMLPDVDLVLSALFPGAVHHHGVTHTVVFVVLVSVLAGAVVTWALGERIDRLMRGERFDRASLFAFTTAAFTLGGLAHLFADMLSAPDISTPIEPFWPFFSKPWAVDVLWYNSIWVNAAFLVAMLLVHAAIAVAVDPFDHRYRLGDEGDETVK